MTSNLYTNNYINFNNEKIFFGEGKNSQRYDVLKYEFFDKLTDKMMGFDWAHDEIICTKDQADFAVITEGMKHAYTSVLQKLIFLDSIQGRGMIQTLGPIVTLPEFEACLTDWQRFEINKHSRSYTHILRSVYSNPTEIFDGSFDIPELLKLASSISTPYEDCFKRVNEFVYKDLRNENLSDKDMHELKKSIIRLLLEINILEGVRFYSGFATIWSMHYAQGYMERTGKILQLICRDENLHLAITQYTLRLLRSKEDEGFVEAYAEWKPLIQDMYREAADQEFEWIDYLFSKGSFLGMTADLAKQYIKYITNQRLKAIGEDIIFPEIVKNPLPWTESYINMDKVETKPQEGEVINYRVDVLNQEVLDEEIEDLKTKLN